MSFILKKKNLHVLPSPYSLTHSFTIKQNTRQSMKPAMSHLFWSCSNLGN